MKHIFRVFFVTQSPLDIEVLSSLFTHSRYGTRRMPHKRRNFGGRKRSKSAPAVLCKTVNRPSKCKTWSNEQMEAAMKAVEGGESCKAAARDHCVPVTTLKDRISGHVVHGTKPGPVPYLTSSEEKELEAFLNDCSQVGYGKTRRDVMSIAETVASDKGVLKGSRISEGWWRRFLERQPKLSLRRGDVTAHVRMDVINKETLDFYFTSLEDVLKEHDLLDKPQQIYNVDESGVPLDPKPPIIVTKKGSKKVRYRVTGKKGQVTVVACANACGQAIPPMVIYDAKKLNHAWTKGEFPGTCYGLSDTGWINTDLFEGWLAEHFLTHAVAARPLLLLLDGHSTHYQPQCVRFAKEHDVIVLCLPPHTTHEAQPLDCGVFAPLKSQWSNVCHTFFQKNPGKCITRFTFSALFAEAWAKAVIPANIIAGFRTCGVYPFSRDAIKIKDPPGKATKPSQPTSPTEKCTEQSFTQDQLERFQL